MGTIKEVKETNTQLERELSAQKAAAVAATAAIAAHELELEKQRTKHAEELKAVQKQNSENEAALIKLRSAVMVRAGTNTTRADLKVKEGSSPSSSPTERRRRRRQRRQESQ